MEYINWVFVPLCIFLGYQYLLGPILVYFNQKIPVQYKFDILDSESFLNERGIIFKDLHNKIISHSFRYIGSSALRMSHSAVYFSVYYSEERKLTCILMTAHATNSTPFTQIEFTQMYTDGTFFGVSNNGIFGAYPKWELKDGYRFPHINDFDALLAVTEKLINRYKSKCTAKPMVNGKEFATIEDHLNDELKHLIDTGWVSPNSDGHEHRLTLKGALLMTWKMCWPIKSLINNSDIKRSIDALNAS